MKLKKELGFLDVFCIASGAMISSGIFVLPSLAFAKSGPAIIISYFLGGVLAFLGILAVIELTTAMPKAGGDYFFIKRALGPMAGTISGMLSWLAISFKTAFAIYGIGLVLAPLIYGSDVTNIQHFSVCFISAVFFIVLNLIGVDFASKFEVVIVVALLLIMLIYVLLGFPCVNLSHFTPFVSKFVDGKNISSGSLFNLENLGTIIATTAVIFVSFGGLLNIASISEEVKNPKRNVVLGLIWSIITITIFYSFMIFVTVGSIDPISLSLSETPIADAARNFAGSAGYYAILIASMLAFVSTANAGIMSASRYPLAMARDNLISVSFASVSSRFKTPTWAIIISGLFIIFALMLPLELLAKTASAVILLSYIMTNASIIVLRESNLRNYQPSFKAKLYPWLQIFIIILFTNFILSFGFIPLFICTSIAAVAFGVYVFYGSKQYKGDYALLHLLLRITNNINESHELEQELLDIIHEREEVTLDYFDNLIKNSRVIELEGKASLEQLFNTEADYLSEELKINSDELVKLFKQREEESTTAFTDFTAIPHVVIAGVENLKMVVVRCKEGIYFNAEYPSIKAVFLFISGGSLAHEHLQILAAVAAVTCESNFVNEWLNANNSEYLKDIILLTQRKRFNN